MVLSFNYYHLRLIPLSGEQDPMEIVDENDLSDGKIPFNKTV